MTTPRLTDAERDALAPLFAEARIEALLDAASVAERDAKQCPDGCTSPRCRESNLTTAAWLRDLAARLGGDA